MRLLVYAITDGYPAAAVAGEGVEGRPLKIVGDDGLVAVVSEHDDPPALTEATLWAFEQAVEGLMSHRAVLPARFGSLVDARHALESVLRERRDELTANLERIRGAVELGVRAIWPTADTEATPSGLDAGSSYMLARVAHGSRARELAARIDSRLGELARAKHCRVLTRPTAPVTASYLVDRASTDEFVARVRDLRGAIRDAEIVCTGPWPPYSFVGSGGDD